MMSAQLPAEFSDLESFVARWAMATNAARHGLRLGSTETERQEFYNALAPRLQAAIDYLNGFDLHALPEHAMVLLRLALSLSHVALAVENNGAAEAEHALSARMLKLSRELDQF